MAETDSEKDPNRFQKRAKKHSSFAGMNAVPPHVQRPEGWKDFTPLPPMHGYGFCLIIYTFSFEERGLSESSEPSFVGNNHLLGANRPIARNCLLPSERQSC